MFASMGVFVQGMRISQLEQKIGVKRAKIYDLISQGVLPRPIKVGAASIWLETEIEDAFKKLIEKRNAFGSGNK
jgi:predicted DNA-binding transcriptional regulator AlpA